MATMGDRLRQMRERAGFESARSAALAHDWRESTYRAHETGGRQFDLEQARRYGRAFRADPYWLLHGIGRGAVRRVPLMGYVGAGSEAHYYMTAQGPLEMVDAPEGATDSTVALEIRGESLGELFDGWLVYYDDVRSPVTEDLLGQLCVVGLADDRVLIKKLRQSATPGLYHLISQTEGPITDVAVLWAARVKHLAAR
ncbi:MAG: XRE family transcriptional regulator [Bauldia sp.]|nr:XRE family transcriptional regulator [Bauldia sp.]